MKKLSVILMAFLLVSTCFVNLQAKESKKKVARIAFFKEIFGHIHQNPSKYSTAITTISCGHPVRVYKVTDSDGRTAEIFNKKYMFIKAGPYDGYILKSLLSSQRPKCFQDKYPRFFDQFEMDISELYNWGRLYDLYLVKRTRVR